MKNLSALFLLCAALIASPVFAADEMPITQQNALVQKYCAVCHTDRARNGGLSLEHFDAANVPPSLAAMMLSKVTGGLSLETLEAALSHPHAHSLVEKQIQGGAMNAAGIAPPRAPVTLAFVAALTRRASAARRWSVLRTDDGIVSASVLREQPMTGAESEMFRLTMTCDTNTRRPAAQLDWSPVPKLGEVVISIDRGNPITYPLRGIEKMGNGGSGKTTGRASASLDQRWATLPKSELSASGLFPTPITFPFSIMPGAVREALLPCFGSAVTTR